MATKKPPKKSAYPSGECDGCRACCYHCQYYVDWYYNDGETPIDPIIEMLDTPGDGWCVVHRKSVLSSLGCNNFLCFRLPMVSQAAPPPDNQDAMHHIAEEARIKYPLLIAQD